MHMLEEHEKAHMHWNRATEGGMKGQTAFTKLHPPLASQCKINDENIPKRVPYFNIKNLPLHSPKNTQI